MRYNILNKNGKIIGQDYQRENGEWMHKWKSVNHNGFDRFSWRGRADGIDSKFWTYEKLINNQ